MEENISYLSHIRRRKTCFSEEGMKTPFIFAFLQHALQPGACFFIPCRRCLMSFYSFSGGIRFVKINRRHILNLIILIFGKNFHLPLKKSLISNNKCIFIAFVNLNIISSFEYWKRIFTFGSILHSGFPHDTMSNYG